MFVTNQQEIERQKFMILFSSMFFITEQSQPRPQIPARNVYFWTIWGVT